MSIADLFRRVFGAGQQSSAGAATTAPAPAAPAQPKPAAPAAAPAAGEPPWLTVARGELGVRERRGGETARIIEYHAATTLRATEDEVPWCSSYVNWCIQRAGLTGTNSAAARSWMTWGQPLMVPRPGAIAVFTRDGGGHVAFFLSDGGNAVKVLGGNQSDEVRVSSYPKARLLGYRWPTAAEGWTP